MRPADKWSEQLLGQVAKATAIDDAIYQLDRALQESQIDIQTFLREVRKQSRKQFECRALAVKIMGKQREAAQAGGGGGGGGGGGYQQQQQRW